METTLQSLSMMRGGLSPNTDLPSTYQSGDDEDETYVRDTLQDTRSGHREKQILDQRILEQKKIDDARIAIVYEALSRGVELKNNQLYSELLQEYPYFQKILSDRKQTLQKLKQQAKLQKQSPVIDFQSQDTAPKQITTRYKFEQKFMDRKVK